MTWHDIIAKGTSKYDVRPGYLRKGTQTSSNKALRHLNISSIISE